jgi:micrococcal nuclease
VPSQFLRSDLCAVVLCTLLGSSAALADALSTALVVHISDGDTLSVLSEGRRHKVTIAGIDAPELDQPHGAAAKRALARLTFNRRV